MHISLDSALGRQRRLNQVGETISSIATPAAAYSLRSLTGGDPKVVRVRRESDNDEQDFTASEVASGAMLDYVNTQAIKPLDIKELVSTGRDGDFILADAAYSLRSLGTRQATIPNDAAPLNADTVVPASGKYVVQVRRNVNGDQKSFTADEVTDGTLVSFVNESFTSSLPLDVQSSAAAYSLRNLSSSYNGNVVEVRRSSNNDTQNFTANEITDGTLLSFVNNDLNIKQTIINNSNSYDTTTGTGTLTSSTSLGFTASGASSLVVSKLGFPQDFSVLAGKIKVTYNASGFTGSARILSRNTAGSSSASAITISNGTGNTATTTLTGETNLFIFDGISGSDVSLEITSLEIIGDGFVRTWYDQSGSSNAVQTTSANQPKIVSAGNLEKDSSDRPEIDFNGSDQFFNIDFGSNLSQPNTIFMVHQSDTTNAADNEFFDETGTTGQRTLLDIDTGGGNYRLFSGTSFTTNQGIDTNKNLIGAFYDGASSYLSKNGTVSSTGDVGSQSIASTSAIGFSEGTNAYYDGTMQEFIIYGSNQSTKRRAIEESISGHYGITLGSFNRDGFVRTWYDQSVSDQAGTTRGNHATQGTASAQPKIVENGSLLTPGVKFEGAQTLSASDPIITASSSGSYSVFSVQTVATSEAGYLYGNASGSNGTSVYAESNTFTISNSFHTTLDDISRSSGQNLLSAVYNSGDAGLLVNGAGTMTDNGTYDFSAGSSNFIIGNRNGSSSDAAFLTGSINEIIVYNSNQSTNRTAIEANIGSVYSIDLPSGVDPGFDQVNGFVETWYDQSGNNNNATQTTAASQPKIVNEGTYLNLVRTDGTDDFFDLTTQIDFNSSHGVFAVYADDGVNRYDLLSNATNSSGIGYAFLSSPNSPMFGMINNGAQERFNPSPGTRTNQNLLCVLWQPDSASAIYSFNGSGNSQSFTLSRYISDTAIPLTVIGKDNDAVGQLDLKEIIIYATDQTSNRTKLEANIAAAHGITLS